MSAWVWALIIIIIIILIALFVGYYYYNQNNTTAVAAVVIFTIIIILIILVIAYAFSGTKTQVTQAPPQNTIITQPGQSAPDVHIHNYPQTKEQTPAPNVNYFQAPPPPAAASQQPTYTRLNGAPPQYQGSAPTYTQIPNPGFGGVPQAGPTQSKIVINSQGIPEQREVSLISQGSSNIDPDPKVEVKQGPPTYERGLYRDDRTGEIFEANVTNEGAVYLVKKDRLPHPATIKSQGQGYSSSFGQNF